MDFCPHCGAGIQDSMKRCPECRRSVEKNNRGEFLYNDKEQKMGALIGLIAGLTGIILVVLIIVGLTEYAIPAGDEPAYTETVYFDCKKSGEQAYVDIVDIIPVLNVRTGEEISNLVCRCTAVSGETFAMYIEVSEFADNFDSEIWTYLGSDYEKTISFAPIRVYGESVYYRDVVVNPHSSVAKTMLLRFVCVE